MQTPCKSLSAISRLQKRGNAHRDKAKKLDEFSTTLCPVEWW